MISRNTISNAIRFLSIDAIEKAKSGHPGAPMGMADIAEVLWRNFMSHNPNNPKWINRDRFILSNGHAVMLLYSILHLTGYNLTIKDIKNFRKMNSKTPGHPEYNNILGIETTTGPLGQGLANAVGIAISEKILSHKFNKLNFNIINHYTYVFVGDGCLMEGISHEVCSLAGTLKLGKLIVFYDSNNISIDGNIKNWFTDDTYKRFKSYGWNVINNINGHNYISIINAIKLAKKFKNKPSLLICNTKIAFGSPNKEGKNISHGSPLGAEEIIKTRKKLKWKYPPFYIPNKIYKYWNFIKNGIKKENKWNKKFNLYKKKFPNLYKELIRRINKKLPLNFDIKINKIINKIQQKKINISGRQSSQNSLEILGSILPELIGGSADLTSSNLTMWSKSISILKNFKGNYIHYGVREFGMTAISNGIANYGCFIPYSSTFLVFSEYAKNAIRMSALMKIRHIMIYTHDSIGVGEDGPTHQPIEQINSLRIIPNLITWRPCDYTETLMSWYQAIKNINGPTVIILSKQILEEQKRTNEQIKNIKKGGYVLKDSIKYPKLIIIATGSEIKLAIKAFTKLNNEGYRIRVVSMPSTNIFDKQNKLYKNKVLPKNIIKRIAIEAGSKDFWYKYVGINGKIIGLSNFGKSGSCNKLFKYFGITVSNIIFYVKKYYNKKI